MFKPGEMRFRLSEIYILYLTKLFCIACYVEDSLPLLDTGKVCSTVSFLQGYSVSTELQTNAIKGTPRWHALLGFGSPGQLCGWEGTCH